MIPATPSGHSRIRFVLMCIVLASASLATLALERGGVAQSSPDANARLRQRTFDVVWKTINDKYFDPQFGGVDWAAVKGKYAPQLAGVKGDTEFIDLLSRMLGELKISHLRILVLANLPKELARAVVTRGVALRTLDQQIVVTRVIERSPAAAAGLKPGFVVTAVDGAPLSDARSAEAAIAGDTMTHRLTILDDTGTRREVSVGYELPAEDRRVSYQILNGQRHVLFETQQLANGIGYIHFTNFVSPLNKRLTTTIQAMRTAPGLIIDLRGNSGGNR